MQRYPQPASGGHTSDREHGGRRFSGGHEGRCIFIVNTARGDLVASAALAKALCSGKIAGAGLDTIAPEPVTTENPLLHDCPVYQGIYQSQFPEESKKEREDA